jgi:hypothetical protein
MSIAARTLIKPLIPDEYPKLRVFLPSISPEKQREETRSLTVTQAPTMANNVNAPKIPPNHAY